MALLMSAKLHVWARLGPAFRLHSLGPLARHLASFLAGAVDPARWMARFGEGGGALRAH